LGDWVGIAEYADKVVLIYWDQLYNPDTPDRDVAELLVAKNGAGRIGRVRVKYCPQTRTYKNL
jgi:replicative DNA helicase